MQRQWKSEDDGKGADLEPAEVDDVAVEETDGVEEEGGKESVRRAKKRKGKEGKRRSTTDLTCALASLDEEERCEQSKSVRGASLPRVRLKEEEKSKTYMSFQITGDSTTATNPSFFANSSAFLLPSSYAFCAIGFPTGEVKSEFIGLEWGKEAAAWDERRRRETDERREGGRLGSMQRR